MKMRNVSFVSALVLSAAIGSIPMTPATAFLDAGDTAGSWTATQSMSVARGTLTSFTTFQEEAER
jgi:hypothetical protein